MANKATLECLLREPLSQLNDAKKQNEQLITCWDEHKRCLQQLQNSTTEIGKTSPKNYLRHQNLQSGLTE